MKIISKLNVLIILSIFSIVSCNKDDDNKNNNIAIENSIVLKINTNNEVSNFLNTINTENISLYYDLNNNLNPLNYAGDYPKGYLIFQEQPINEKLIKIFCYVGENSSEETTYIKWNENDMDNLTYKVHKSASGNINLSDFKFNSIPINNNNEFGIYSIIKN